MKLNLLVDSIEDKVKAVASLLSLRLVEAGSNELEGVSNLAWKAKILDAILTSF